MSEMESQHLERGSVKKDPTNSYVESCPKLVEGGFAEVASASRKKRKHTFIIKGEFSVRYEWSS